MTKPIKLNQELIDKMVDEKHPFTEWKGSEFHRVLRLRMSYDKELKEELKRQQSAFTFENVGKFLLLPLLGGLLLATILVNVISKVSGCGFVWEEPKPQKCLGTSGDSRTPTPFP